MPDSRLMWFLIEEAPDLPGTWSIHCLDLDVISQGSSRLDAITMGLEAAWLCLKWDEEDGFDANSRNKAPLEDWARLEKALGPDGLAGVTVIRALVKAPEGATP